MNKMSKQRNQVKKTLKEKLISYQNETIKQPDIIFYQGNHTTDLQKKQSLSNVFRIQKQLSPSKYNKSNNNYHQYNLYLNCNTLDSDYNVSNKKSLTKQNIVAINKKAKAIKESLSQMAKQTKCVGGEFVPLRLLENICVARTQEKYKFCYSGEKKKDNVKVPDNLLTLNHSTKSKKEKLQETPKRPLSHQQTRIIKYFSTEKPFQTPNRPKTSKTQYISQKINPEVPDDLTEYFTPCYHKQTNSGFIVNSFQPRLKIKHFQDNVKVMAKVIKKKILKLEREEIINYLKQIGQRRKYSQPDNTINQTVRRSNYLHEKNLLEQKINKGKRPQSSKKSSTIKI